MSNTGKGYKTLISVIAFVSSFICASFVFGYVNESGLSVGWAFGFRLAASMAVISVCWMIAALFRRKNKG